MTHPKAVDRISKGGMCQEADWSVYSASSYQDALHQILKRWGLFIMAIRRNEQATRKIIRNKRALLMWKGRVFLETISLTVARNLHESRNLPDLDEDCLCSFQVCPLLVSRPTTPYHAESSFR